MSHMGYILRDRTDGIVELVETRPTVVATFANRAIAEQMFAAFMKNKPASMPVSAAKVSATPSNNPVERAVVTPQPVMDPVARMPASDDEWNQAFTAIATGGRMSDVAETLGVTMPQLKGKYGAWCKVQKMTCQPATSLVSAPKYQAEVEKEDCRLCGKQFAASLSADGLCARCRH